MARISAEELERLKTDISVERLVEGAGIASLATSAYEYYAGHEPGWGAGEDRPAGGAYGDPGSSCHDPVDGHVPEDYYDVNTFGNNLPLTGGYSDCFYQSGACSTG